MSDPMSEERLQNEVISEEDRKEILSEIEKIAAANRIDVSLDHLNYSPQRNGALFPVLANLGGLILLAAGLYLLFYLFQTESETIRETATPLTATESRLIEELQREAEEQLAVKEAEIEAINARLESINAEREELARDIDEQIAQREAELEEQFQAELEAERRRLLTLNLSDAEFEARLAEFEAEKREEYDARLEAVRGRFLAERERLENDLDRLESQFSRTLEEVNRERQAIVQESEARVSELRSEFESRLQQTEAERTAAEEELRALNRSRDRELLIRGQIAGLYGNIQDALEEEGYSEALNHVESLRSLLLEPTTVQIDALREERSADLFMLSTIENYVETLRAQQRDEPAPTGREATLVQRVVELEAEAAEAVEAGETELAETLYRRVIETIPSVASSYAFLQQSEAAAAPQASASEEELALAEAAVAAGESALTAGDYERSFTSFLEVVTLYDTTPFRERAIAGLQESVTGIQTALEQQIEATEAAETESVAASDRAAELEGRIDTLREQRSALQAQRESLTGQLETARERNDQQRERVDELQGQIAASDEEIARLGETITERNRELAESRRTAAELQERLSVLSEQTATGPELIEELTRLREVQTQLDEAEEFYRIYRSNAASLGDTTSTIDVVERKLLLDQFLGSEAMLGFFPDLLEEIRRFEAIYERSGRENAMIDVADAVFEISSANGNSARLAQVRELRSRNDSPLMRDFLDELELLLEQ